MNHISLFSGIGGFDLASEWIGWRNVLSCEIADFPNRILEYYWPEAYHHRDIHTLTPEIIEKELTQRFGHEWRSDGIILTGGFPCQPFSAAGKRKGTEDSRHLWPEMLRVIRGIRPDYIVGENVAGLVNWSGGLVFEQVFADLEDAGYEVGAFMVPACATGAPHRRDRIWFVANSDNRSRSWDAISTGREKPIQLHGLPRVAPDTNGRRNQRHGNELGEFGKMRQRWKDNEAICNNDEGRENAPNNISIRPSRQKYRSERSGKYSENHQGYGWQNFPSQPPICSGDDGLPTKLDGVTFPKWRNESIKGYGNAVVPQVVYEFFKMIEAHKNKFSKPCNISDR